MLQLRAGRKSVVLKVYPDAREFVQSTHAYVSRAVGYTVNRRSEAASNGRLLAASGVRTPKKTLFHGAKGDYNNPAVPKSRIVSRHDQKKG